MEMPQLMYIISGNPNIAKGQLWPWTTWCRTYQSPLPRGSPALALALVSREGWPAAADAKLDGRCEGIAAFIFSRKIKAWDSNGGDGGTFELGRGESALLGETGKWQGLFERFEV